MSVTKLPNKKKESAKEVLNIAMEQDYNELVIIGFKDGKYYVQHTELADGMKVIGALTIAQYELLKAGE